MTNVNSPQISSAQTQIHAEVLKLLHTDILGVVALRSTSAIKALELIRTYAASRKLPHAIWSTKDPLGEQTSDQEPEDLRGIPAFETLRRSRGNASTCSPGFYSMIFPHFCMADSQPTRVPMIYAIKEYARAFPGSKRRLLLIVPPTFTPPAEIRDDMVILDFDTPSYAELYAALEGLISTFKRKPVLDDVAKAQIVSAGMGMAHEEFVTAVSRAIVNNRPNIQDSTGVAELLVRDIMEVKTEVVKRSEMLEVMPSADMSEVGGLELLKDRIGKRAACFSHDAKDFGIEPPKDVGLIGPPGTRVAGQPAGSKVLAGDGTWIKIEDLAAGDCVMSQMDDKSIIPVEVARIEISNSQEIFRLTTTGRSGAKTFVCSGDHVLSLIAMERPRRGSAPRRRHTEQREVSVFDFLQRGPSWRNKVKARTSCAFDLPDAQLPVDPHTLGVILGDGCLTELLQCYMYDYDLDRSTGTSAEIISEHKLLEVVASRENWCAPTPLTDRNASQSRIPEGPIKQGLRALRLTGVNSHSKFVPEVYLAGSLHQRLALLAGLIDTDGDRENFYTTSTALANAFHQLIYSVGGTAHIRDKKTFCKGKLHDSLAVSYSTAEHVIPTVLDRKRREARNMAWKNPRNTAFKIERAGRERVYGLTLIGDAHRYITDDFLVTSSKIPG